MAGPTLPKLPEGLDAMGNVAAASVLGEWLFKVAQTAGEAGLDHALAKGWPGTKAQRALVADGAIQLARNEARQIETWKV